MNTRTPIQPSASAVVLSLSFSLSRKRFVAACSDGFRVLRTDNCLTTHRSEPSQLDVFPGLALAAVLDDRYVAFVAGGRAAGPKKGNVVIFWDCILGSEICRFNFYEAVLGLRLCSRWMVVVLKERTVVFEYLELQRQQRPSPPPEWDDARASFSDFEAELRAHRGPNKPHSIHRTSFNPYALVSLVNDLLILPAQTVGQLQLISLKPTSTSTSQQQATKRVLRVHNTALRNFTLSISGGLLATASEQGTLVRVYSTKSLAQIAEFRRGMEKAIVSSLAFSPGDRWLAATSDKGTIHMFDLRPSAAPASASSTPPLKTPSNTQHRKSQSQSVRFNPPPPSQSGHSSSPSTVTATPSTAQQGSIQEYYGLRPPPSSASHASSQAAISAVQAFKQSSLAPSFTKDVRSVASAPFYTGSDPPHWQGGQAHSWTTMPSGTRKRVNNPVLPLPNDPSGRPQKGTLTFAAQDSQTTDDDDGATFYVLGGGSDARWEKFELLPAEGGSWVLVNRGFRRFMIGRQFVD